MKTVRMMNFNSFGQGQTCVRLGTLVRETPKSYFFQHPFFTANEPKRVGQAGVYHVEPCKHCPDSPRG